MKLMKKIGIICLVAFGSILSTTSAFAQTNVLVVDQARVLHESEVGKHIRRQLKSIGESMTTEMKSQVQPLTSERDRLMAELKSISVEDLKTRPDLQQRAKSLQTNVSKSKREEAYKQRELQVTEQKALKKVNEKLTKILENLVKERKADIVLDRSLVIFTGPKHDVTKEVISRLNSQMRSVTVSRERLPRQTK